MLNHFSLRTNSIKSHSEILQFIIIHCKYSLKKLVNYQIAVDIRSWHPLFLWIFPSDTSFSEYSFSLLGIKRDEKSEKIKYIISTQLSFLMFSTTTSVPVNVKRTSSGKKENFLGFRTIFEKFSLQPKDLLPLAPCLPKWYLLSKQTALLIAEHWGYYWTYWCVIHKSSLNDPLSHFEIGINVLFQTCSHINFLQILDLEEWHKVSLFGDKTRPSLRPFRQRKIPKDGDFQ